MSTKQNTPAEQPKQQVAETTTKSTPVNERRYKLVAEPSIAPKGKQRQIVLNALKSTKNPMTVKEVAAFAAQNGLTAVGGIEPSCRYHLHHLQILKIAEVVNPTVTIEKKADNNEKVA